MAKQRSQVKEGGTIVPRKVAANCYGCSGKNTTQCYVE
jgi:hypothetical protein